MRGQVSYAIQRLTASGWVDVPDHPYLRRREPAEPLGSFEELNLADIRGKQAVECKLYETRCEDCGAYMQVRPPAGWIPKPVFVQCDDCIAKLSEPTDKNQQELIKEFRKMVKAGW